MDTSRTFAEEGLDAAVPPAPKHDCAPAPEKKRTMGNIIYDFGVFGSVAWFGVAALSAISAHEALHGNNRAFGWLRKLNDSVTHKLSDSLSKGLLKNASKETVDGYARGTAMFLTLGMGGNALMAPIKWLEDNRQKNACRIDKLLGTTPENPELVADEPPQSWKSVLSGRMFSWGMSYAAFLAMGPKITGALSNWFGKKAADGIMHMKPAANPATVRRWTDIAAFDALFTVITAALTYGFSRYVARKDYQKTSVDDELYVLNPIAPNPLDGDPQPARETAREKERSHVQRLAQEPGRSFAERISADNGGLAFAR